MLGLVGDSKRAGTFTAVGITECVVRSGRVAGIVFVTSLLWLPVMHTEQKKQLVYLSCRKKKGMKRLHI